MVCQINQVVQKIYELHEGISRLDNLKPSKDVDMLFTQLVHTCIPPNPIDVTKLCLKTQEMRYNLIRLCGEAEGLLESHYSSILASLPDPLENLSIFPYFNNYLKLSLLEFSILTCYTSGDNAPRRVAFVGSGPLPLTSIVLATCHLPATVFYNYDIDPKANSMASRLVGSDPELSQRMLFLTTDIMNVTYELKEYDVVFLAALVGMNKEEKGRAIDHLAKYMAPGALLLLRSAHGARAFLYPVVDPRDLRGFEVLTVHHPTNDVINSVILARKTTFPDDQGTNTSSLVLPSKCSTQQVVHSYDQGTGSTILLPNKCSSDVEIHTFSPLNKLSIVEEFAIDQEQHS